MTNFSNLQPINDLLSGAVDCHVHSYPDVIARSTTDVSLVQQASDAKIGGLVLKCHHAPTAARAWLLNEMQGDVRVFGGIVLNDAVGGLNPFATEAAITMGATQIWMPTKSAANHCNHLGGRGGLTIFNGNRIRTEVIDILKQIAQADRVLATGHLSPLESRVLAEEALALGVGRISVTHPEWGVTAVPVEVQQQLAATGKVFFERCLVSVQHDIPLRVEFAEIAKQIRAVGVETTIAATDYGMPQYGEPVCGMRDFIVRLIESGFDADQIRQMVNENPRRLLRMDTEAGS